MFGITIEKGRGSEDSLLKKCMGDNQYHVQPLTNPGLVTFQAWDAILSGCDKGYLQVAAP